MVDIFTKGTIPCDSYKITSETIDTYDNEVAQNMSNDISKFMYNEAIFISSTIEKPFKNKIEEVMELNYKKTMLYGCSSGRRCD